MGDLFSTFSTTLPPVIPDVCRQRSAGDLEPSETRSEGHASCTHEVIHVPVRARAYKPAPGAYARSVANICKAAALLWILGRARKLARPG